MIFGLHWKRGIWRRTKFLEKYCQENGKKKKDLSRKGCSLTWYLSNLWLTSGTSLSKRPWGLFVLSIRGLDFWKKSMHTADFKIMHSVDLFSGEEKLMRGSLKWLQTYSYSEVAEILLPWCEKGWISVQITVHSRFQRERIIIWWAIRNSVFWARNKH